MRILCTADWQLGKAFGRVGPAGDSFREQLFLTAEKIITTTAEEHGADIILILGELLTITALNSPVLRVRFRSLRARNPSKLTEI